MADGIKFTVVLKSIRAAQVFKYLLEVNYMQ